jgi:signal transduction histidine kinase
MTDEELLQRRLARERKARQKAEEIAERVTSELYATVGELRQASDELEAANEAIKEFVAIASHDLRSPLTSVIGYSELLLGRWEMMREDQKREFLGVIHEQAKRLERLVEDLLTISRIEAGAMHAQPEEIPLALEIQRTVAELGEAAACVAVSAPSGLKVLADPDHVRRVLENYISNAIKYGRPPIRVFAQACDDSIEVRVTDEGDGVPDSLVPRLFGKFVRGDTETSRKKGTGLGLSIVRGLAQVNGGDAWYEPNEPHGSRFALRVPRA